MGSWIRAEVPHPPPASQPVSTPEVKEAARLEAQRLRRQQGYQSTIVTGPQGVTVPATTKKETLG